MRLHNASLASDVRTWLGMPPFAQPGNVPPMSQRPPRNESSLLHEVPPQQEPEKNGREYPCRADDPCRDPVGWIPKRKNPAAPWKRSGVQYCTRNMGHTTLRPCPPPFSRNEALNNRPDRTSLPANITRCLGGYPVPGKFRRFRQCRWRRTGNFRWQLYSFAAGLTGRRSSWPCPSTRNVRYAPWGVKQPDWGISFRGHCGLRYGS